MNLPATRRESVQAHPFAREDHGEHRPLARSGQAILVDRMVTAWFQAVENEPPDLVRVLGWRCGERGMDHPKAGIFDLVATLIRTTSDTDGDR